jgi:hypothetical protein
MVDLPSSQPRMIGQTAHGGTQALAQSAIQKYSSIRMVKTYFPTQQKVPASQTPDSGRIWSGASHPPSAGAWHLI